MFLGEENSNNDSSSEDNESSDEAEINHDKEMMISPLKVPSKN